MMVDCECECECDDVRGMWDCEGVVDNGGVGCTGDSPDSRGCRVVAGDALSNECATDSCSPCGSSSNLP